MMASPTSILPHTAFVLVDPFNDFLHPSGKLHARLSKSLSHTNARTNLQRLVSFAHTPATRIQIFYALHQPHAPTAYAGWAHANRMHAAMQDLQLFDVTTPNAAGVLGGDILSGLEPDLAGGDVVASRHWTHSALANTDLAFLMGQRDITDVVIAGMEVSTCVESTVRAAYELGYNVTVVKDGSAGFSIESWKASVEGVWGLLPIRIATTAELLSEWEGVK